MAVRKVQQGFVAGELSPAMYGRFDDNHYGQGLATCRNFIVLPQGPAVLRPGTSYVREAKLQGKKCRLIPFTFSVDDAMVLEFGDKYVRFHTRGQTLLGDDGQPYEIETPYAEDDVFDIHFVQSMDVMTLVHPAYAPRELRRYGATDWRLVEIDFGIPIEPPEAPECTFKVVAGSGITITDEEKKRYTLKYKVTAVKETDTGDAEGAPSPIGSCEGNLYLNNATVTLTWKAVSGATRYRVYKNYKGLYAFIGETEELTFIDDNYSPDAGITPPIYDDPFLQAKGIQSVKVDAGGSGYAQRSLRLLDFKPTSEQVENREEVGVSIVTGFRWETRVSHETLRPSIPPYPSVSEFRAEVYDASGPGTGAQVELVVSKYSGSKGDGERYDFESWAGLQVEEIRIVKPGSGYVEPKLRLRCNNYGVFSGTRTPVVYRLSMPTERVQTSIVVSDKTGYGAELEPVVADGKIVSVNIRSPGTGYTNPTLKVVSQDGSGAKLTATVGSAGDYPGAVCYFEQRRCFGGPSMRPQMVWMTRTGTESDMSYTLPSQDDNRVKFRIAAQEASRVLHLIPLQQLVVLTNSTEYRVSSGGSAPVAPDAVDSKVQAQVGSSNVQPVIVNSTLVYASARGGHIRELGYSYQAGGYVTGDLSIRAAHLFESARAVDMAFAKAPDPIVWVCMSDGTLAGLTYLPEQSVGGWHVHSTLRGSFESVCVVPEGDEDILYCVVNRMIDGKSVRFVERMHERAFTSLADAFHVDCGGEYQGDATEEVSGLTWLEGEKVSILADGCVLPQQEVKDGKVTLPKAARHVIVGLPITADLQTLPLAVQLSDGSYGTGHMKNINQVWVRVYRSSGVFAGPDFDNLTEVRQRTFENYGTPPAPMSKEASVVISPKWGDSGQLCIRQKDPLPLTVVSVSYDLAS